VLLDGDVAGAPNLKPVVVPALPVLEGPGAAAVSVTAELPKEKPVDESLAAVAPPPKENP